MTDHKVTLTHLDLNDAHFFIDRLKSHIDTFFKHKVKQVDFSFSNICDVLRDSQHKIDQPSACQTSVPCPTFLLCQAGHCDLTVCKAQ